MRLTHAGAARALGRTRTAAATPAAPVVRLIGYAAHSLPSNGAPALRRPLHTEPTVAAARQATVVPPPGALADVAAAAAYSTLRGGAAPSGVMGATTSLATPPGGAAGYATASSRPWHPKSVTEVALPGDFTTTLGQVLKGVRLRVEQHGLCALPPSRTVVIFPSFSHSSHVASNADDPSPGWWQEYVGAGKPIDTRHWRVICISVLGSPFSPTNPTATDPATGRQYRARFPQLTPTDLARCHAEVLRQLGFTIEPYAPAAEEGAAGGGSSGTGGPTSPGACGDKRHEPLHAVVGASLGGMQTLQFASLFPSSVSRLVSIASTGRTTPFTVGIRRMQRRAILADPDYARGDYADVPGRGPWEGLKQAREIGTLFYRSRQEMDARFNWSPAGDRHFTSLDTWEVESYLNYAGAKFARTYDANAYLLLSKCMDLQDLGDGVDGRHTYAEGAARISADTLLVGVKQDALIPPGELAMLADTINGEGNANATYLEMDSAFGHDAFLKEAEWLGPRLRAHLEAGLEAHLAQEAVINTGVNAP